MFSGPSEVEESFSRRLLQALNIHLSESLHHDLQESVAFLRNGNCRGHQEDA